MMLAHGSVEVFYVMVGLFWLVNLALLLPVFFARRAYLAVLVVTLMVTVFDGWFVWDTLRDTLPLASTERTFGAILTGLFGILFLGGCYGIVRWMRLSKS